MAIFSASPSRESAVRAAGRAQRVAVGYAELLASMADVIPQWLLEKTQTTSGEMTYQADVVVEIER
jgi:hypothetical protein